MPAETGKPTAAIAYVIGTYPMQTTTFIDREIEALRRRDIGLHLISIRRPTPEERVLEASETAQSVIYLLPARWSQMLAAHVRWALSRPGLFFTLPFYLFTRPHPSLLARVKTLLHFSEGVLAAAQLEDQRIAHVHAHFADRAAVVAWVAARLLGVSYSLFAHANDIYIAPVLLPEKIKHASFVATCTEYNRAHLTAVGAEHRPWPIERIYHGLDLSRFQPPVPRRLTQQRILSVGQLREKKGHVYLIHACRQLRDRGYSFTCDIIGDGSQRDELQTLVESLQLTHIVCLRGMLPHREVLAYYEQASVFALASVIAPNADRDGIPNVFLEAMAMRVPVVGTQLSGIPELIRDGVNGLLVSPGEAGALAEAIARIWDDPALADRLADQGRATVEQDFNIEKNVGHLAHLFERFLQNQAALEPIADATPTISTPS
ncbi:MAG TPA: glycosyltransferase [Anaerolineae bacterium]|nr:glycosyltransferase [Anaerolineae bacterium]